MPNRLADEQSPYLLQHKDNPVDWHPWGEEAFEKARREDKPVFLSIGYSTCHWCHVMEHESFEDEEAARVLNEHTVPIKVDREERPDLDNIYMRVCQMMTGRGGWPLSIFLTPDREPFHAATYLPKRGRMGQMGLMELVPEISRVWHEERDEVRNAAQRVTSGLQQAASPAAEAGGLGEEALRDAYAQLRQRYDSAQGGFGSAPKFPTPHHLLFLLRHWKRTGEDEALDMVCHTLDQMRLGGVYDHLGYGFHRYSTDARWLLPHFEKMLYDQALLALAYLEAYQATEAERYAETAREIFTYVLRDMTAEEGGFFSAEDADSEGEEGTFYVWTTEEVREVLDAEQAEVFIQAYNLEEEGNFAEEATGEKTGANILHLEKPIAELASDFDREPEQLADELAEARRQLFTRREERERPARDDKILTDWNGLMIGALARAGRVLGEARYTEAAQRSAAFLLETMRDADGRLLHRYRNGEAGIRAHLDDYAFLIFGLVELYETTFEADYLRRALQATDELTKHFWDDDEGGYYFAPDDGEALIVRQKELRDTAMPSGNSVMAWNLIRLARLTGRTALEERADTLIRVAASQVQQQPTGFTGLLVGVSMAVGPSREVVIAGDREAEDTQALLAALDAAYLPNTVRLFRPAGEEQPGITELAPFTEAQTPRDGQAAAYVCEQFACQAPVTTTEGLLAQLP